MEFSTGGGMAPPPGMPQGMAPPPGMPQGMAPQQAMPQAMPQGLAQLLPSAQQLYGSQLLNRVRPSQEMMAAPQAPPTGMQININTPNFDALAAAQAATRERAQMALGGGMGIPGAGKGRGLSGKGTGISGLAEQRMSGEDRGFYDGGPGRFFGQQQR